MISNLIFFIYLNKKYLGIFSITIIYLLTIVLMLPLREAAYGDDFAYIKTAEHLFQTGELKLSEWAAASIISQIYWGVLFAKIFGFSMKILQLSNLFLLYFGLLAFYLLLKRLKISNFRATIFTLFLLSFPWVFEFVYSFMSDVFYMSLLIISLYFYVKALQDNHHYDYLLGSIFAGLAFLNRQIGIILPISIFLVLLYQSMAFKKIYFSKFIYSLVPVTIIILLYTYWQSYTPMTAGQYLSLGPHARQSFLKSIWPLYSGHTSITNSFYIQILQRSMGYFYQLGGFLFPMIFIFVFRIKDIKLLFLKHKRHIFIITLILLVIYKIDNIYGSKMSIGLPDILFFDTFLQWGKFWQSFAFLSYLLLGLVITVSINRLIPSLFVKKIIPLSKYFKILTVACFLWALYHFYTIFNLSIKTKPHFQASFIHLNLQSFIPYLKNPDNLPTIMEILNETWFFFLVILIIGFLLSFFLTHYRLRFSKKIHNELIFLGLVFIFEGALMIITTYFYWQYYVIQIIPLVLIGIAYLSYRVRISVIRSILITFLLLLLSLETTRNIYQLQGAKWETGVKLVEEGADVRNINTVNWAWRPYWLFDSSFEEAVKKAGGDKYKVSQIGQWDNNKGPGPIYSLISIKPEQEEEISRNQPIILKSQPFWTFEGFKEIVVTKDE